MAAHPVQNIGALSMPGLLSPELARSLAEVGFLAIDQRDWPRAHQIFSVLKEFRPESEFPYVGLALIELLQSRREAAAEEAKRGLARVPESRALIELLDIVLQNGVSS
jgi:hypothetical protein